MADVGLVGVPTFDQLEIVRTGIITFPALAVSNPGAGNYDSGTAVTQIDHNLGYTPIVIASLLNNNIYYPMPFVNFTGGAGTANRWYQLNVYAVGEISIYASIEVTVTGQTWNSSASDFSAKYYLLRSSAKPR
jgi:hypothetical protein